MKTTKLCLLTLVFGIMVHPCIEVRAASDEIDLLRSDINILTEKSKMLEARRETDIPVNKMLVIPDIAIGYEEAYRRFLKGKLIYHPTLGSDVGKIELPIADLTNPLEGTFDLSRCGDIGRHLSIATGYRKAMNPKNVNKVEIWVTPWFLAQRKSDTIVAHHYLRMITIVFF